jgi:formylglycine-generating enzyme required for sulfatase activity
MRTARRAIAALIAAAATAAVLAAVPPQPRAGEPLADLTWGQSQRFIDGRHAYITPRHANATMAMVANPPAVDQKQEERVPSSMPTEGGVQRQPETFDFGQFGIIHAVEVLRTPSVWEGYTTADSAVGAVVLQIQTTVGEVVYVQFRDGTVLQSLPMGDGQRIVHLSERLLGCGGALQPDLGGAEQGVNEQGGLAGNCDDGTVLDVLVKWTPLAEQQAGGRVAIRAVAEASIALSNHTYLASGVGVYMRGLGLGVTEPFDGDALPLALNLLTNSGDGYLDGVHAERNALGADLVALLTAPNPNDCGRAWILGTNSPSWGFSITVWDCVPWLTFTHEIGHNQGCCHALGDGGGCDSGGVFPYSVGHRFVGTNGYQFRSVMAYTPGEIIPRLSSPITLYRGTPTGLVDRDNARTLRETANVMANFRCAQPNPYVQPYVRSPVLALPVTGGSVDFTATDVPWAETGTQVEIWVSAIGDLNASDETVSLRIGTFDLGVVTGGGGSTCQLRLVKTSIPSNLFNQAIGSGQAVSFTLTTSQGVGGCTTVEPEISLELRYRAVSHCGGDLNDDGTVDGGDLGALVSSWGSCQGCAADINGDGLVNGADLGALVVQWGGCTNASPVIVAVSPSAGPSVGGTAITLTGADFTGTTSVTIGGAPCTNVQVVSSTSVTAVTPAGTVGAKTVTVTTPSGIASLASGFAYASVVVPPWATLLELFPDPAVVTDPAHRAAITATGLAWHVKDTATQIEMVLIPPGSIQMGCSASQSYGCNASESPVHTVTLTNAFYMGRYEVTQAQWQATMGSNPSWFQSASAQVPAAQVSTRPVESVSWNTIQGFLAQTGMRLPTEAEWEYAYRAGTTTAFHGFTGQLSGTDADSLLGNIAWFASNSNNQSWPVGGKLRNGYGLHDMSGNVWEWVNDWYSSNYYSSSPQNNPPGPATGTSRVVRGGSWNGISSFCRVSYRTNAASSSAGNNIGFRVVKQP